MMTEWKVSEERFGIPYRIDLGTHRQELEALYLRLALEPRTRHEMNDLLVAETGVPAHLATALEITLWRNLFAQQRLVDSTFGNRQPGEPTRVWTTERGAAHLEAQKETQ